MPQDTVAFSPSTDYSRAPSESEHSTARLLPTQLWLSRALVTHTKRLFTPSKSPKKTRVDSAVPSQSNPDGEGLISKRSAQPVCATADLGADAHQNTIWWKRPHKTKDLRLTKLMPASSSVYSRVPRRSLPAEAADADTSATIANS